MSGASKMNNLLFVSNIHTIMDEFKNRILAEYRVELETATGCVQVRETEDEVDILRKEKSVLERTIGELKIVLENVHQERDILRDREFGIEEQDERPRKHDRKYECDYSEFGSAC